MIPHEKVTRFVERWKTAGSSLHPSFFELTMMMAFDWFAEEKVDYAIIEVGMGGRLDSTNIITPIGCVITNISKDHTQFLGSTRPEIAFEKAGIIKPGIPVVIGEAQGDVRRVFEEKGRQVGVMPLFAEDFPLLKSARSEGLGTLNCKSDRPELEFVSPLAGEYQKKNINTVLHAVEMLRKTGIEISEEAEKKGLEKVVTNTGFMGRWTVLGTSPAVIADTGHNEAGLTSNFVRLDEIMRERPDSVLRIVFGMVADKDIDHILDLLPRNAVYYFTQASIPRALPASDMASKASEHGLHFPYWENVKEAYDAAVADSEPEDVIYVGGSTFVVADFLAADC